MSDDRLQMAFRLPPVQMNRMEKCAKYLRQTKQTFVENAVLEKMAEIEDQRQLKSQRYNGHSYQNYDTEAPAKTSKEPGGLGLAAVVRQRQEVPEAVSPAPAPVVVNVGNSTANGDVIERLATYVAAGSDLERDSRLRTSVNVLHASATSDEEKKVLAARLDEAVAAKLKTSVGGSSVSRVARIAFDKLADILR